MNLFMNAEEMFKKLGYIKRRCFDDFIVYEKGNYIRLNVIEFHLRTEIVHSYIESVGLKGLNSIKNLDVDELKAVIQQVKELGWLEEEKQETNYEHFKDEIIEDGIWNLALVNGKPKRCHNVYCKDCEFKTSRECKKKLEEWLNKPYEKPKYKITQFEYDLLSVHKDYKTYNNIANQIHLFKMREKGYFRDVDTSTPIHEILDNCKVV